MKLLLQLNFDTSLPQIVCSCCTDRVKSFYDFYRVVLDNQENLKILIFDDETFEEEEANVEVFAQEISVKTEQQSNVCKVRQKPTWDVERISKFIAFRCDECPSEQLPDFIEWRNHMKICHDTDNPSYVCCETKLTTEKSFLTHINKFHDLTKKRRFSCAICMRKFNHKAQIEKHMRVHLRHVPDGYQCKKCPETFMLVTHWRTHQLLHMPNASDNEILFPCKKCPEEFATIKLLQAHLRNQHKQKFLCDLCAEVFYMKFALSEHIRKTHMPNPRAYKCPQCEVAFLNKGNLRNHIKLLHTKKGVYPCDKCDKVLVTERQLKNHTQYTHKLDRNFPCKYCQKGKYSNF